MRLYLWLFISVSILYSSSTVVKIEHSKKNLAVIDMDKKNTSKHLEEIAYDIKSIQREILALDAKIDRLSSNKLNREKKYTKLKAELKKYNSDFLDMSNRLDKKHKEFISLLSKQFSVVFAMEHIHEPTQESVIYQEVYSIYKNYNKKILSNLKSEIGTLKKSKRAKEILRNRIKSEIENIVKKRRSYISKKRQKEILHKRLADEEERYSSKLEKIVDRQNSLRVTLEKLNILHKKEVDEAKRIAAARKEAIRRAKERQRRIRKAKALAQQKAIKAQEALKRAKNDKERNIARLASIEAEKERQKAYAIDGKVRQINSSYHRSQVYRYKGEKTISPLSNARVIKRFGTYIDPIYKIKIFNESVTLKSSTSNAKVKNVLNGKVVFAGKSSMLGKVVVVAHSHRMHTVYAGLSKIAPTIHVGSKIKRGYVVGKVARKLIFQATKNSKHIDPLKLISI